MPVLHREASTSCGITKSNDSWRDFLSWLLYVDMKLLHVQQTSPVARHRHNRESILLALYHFGHMRHRELSRLVWPKASDAVRETSASRLLKRLCDEGYIVRRLNSIGSYSYVLGKQGAMEISNLLNIPVCDGTRICGVQGRDVFHRTLSTAWMVEQLTSGREVLSEFAINSLGGDITKSALLQHWGRTPDGLVLHEVRDEAGNFIHYNVDWLEVEASYKGRAHREKMMNIAWSLGRQLLPNSPYYLDRMVFVFAKMSSHKGALVRSATEKLDATKQVVDDPESLLRSIALVEVDVSLPLTIHGYTETDLFACMKCDKRIQAFHR